MPTYCSVYGCLNSSLEKPGLSFFKVPSDTERRAKWLQLISREDLNDRNPKYYRVCEEHFRVQDKLPSNNRMVLKRSAVPSLYLPQFTKNGDETEVTMAPVENCLQTVKVAGSNDDSDEESQKLRKKRSYEEEEIDSEVEESNKDICKKFSDHVHEKLSKYNERVRNQVEDKISKILNEADLGYYDAPQNTISEPSTSVIAVSSEVSSSNSVVPSTPASRPNDANKNNLMLVNTVETDLAYVQVVKRRFK